MIKKITSCIIYIIFAIFASCENEPNNDIIKEEITTIIVEDNIIEDEEKSMNLKPIKEYEKYIFTENGNLYGILDKKVEAVTVKDTDDKEIELNDFFKLDNVIYCNIKVMEKGNAIPDPIEYEAVEKVYYFYQISGEMFSTTISKYPAKPESVRVEMEKTGVFEIKNENVFDKVSGKKMDASAVYQGNKKSVFLFVDGFYKTDSGLWFSVHEGYPANNLIRKKGLHFWEIRSSIKQCVLTSGRIW